MTMITVDADRRVVISCRPSTVRFVGNLVIFGFVVAVSLRVLVKLGLGFWGKVGFRSKSGVVRRRDRSLGGREVVVATKRINTRDGESRALENPLASVRSTRLNSSEERRLRRMEEKLPSWWPVSLPPPVLIDEKEKYQRMANRLIRGLYAKCCCCSRRLLFICCLLCYNVSDESIWYVVVPKKRSNV